MTAPRTGPSGTGPPATPRVSERTAVQASAHAAYDAVSDVRRMGEWSPECRGARRVRPAGPVRPGTTFLGINRGSWLPWATRCRVTEATPGHRFAFHVSFLGVPLALWTYRFSETPEGCEVVAEWTDCRRGLPGRVLTFVTPVVTGVFHRERRNQRTTRATLDALRTTLEAGP